VSHFVRLFKPQFAGLVESCAKLQTIRPVPKRMPKAGDTISLRAWTGLPYRSKQRVLLESKIAEVGLCHIEDRGVILYDCKFEPTAFLVDDYADRFAWRDGFKDWPEMRDWFKRVHGLPFSGIIIYWEGVKL